MKTLFRLGFCVVAFFTLITTFAQDKKKSEDVDLAKEIGKVFGTKVTMDVDTLLFDTHQGNFYISESSKAMIMTMVAPQSFEQATESFEKEDTKADYKLIEKKKITHDGRTILYQKGTIEKDGNKAVMYMYGIEGAPESTLFITGMHMEGDEAKFFPAIEHAAFTAKLSEK